MAPTHNRSRATSGWKKIRFMDEKGLFLMKGSVEKAAEKLGVGKVTIYSYLDEVRGKRG